ncbi:MAG: PLP-dependent aminotransferase family protein [Planctomycetales bacterium]
MSTADIPTRTPSLRFSTRRDWAARQVIGYLMQQAVENPRCLSLAAGLVDEATLPVAETRQAFARLFAGEGRARTALQYGTTPGAESVRKVFLKNLARLEGRAVAELGISPDRLVLTTGSQQLLSIVGEVLIDPGDICIVGGPTYFVFLGTLHGLGAEIVSIPTDEHGLRMDLLDEALARIDDEGRLDRVKLIYLVDYYANPSGMSLSEERRREVVEIAHRWSRGHRIFILEDAAYRELRYDGPALPSVWSFDEEKETVILAQTFSKSFAPGLRTGFGVVPESLLKPVCDRKSNEDFGSSNFNQNLIAAVIEQGLYEPHVEMVCDAYRAKRDAMVAAAERYFADIPGASWLVPDGGLYVWMSLPESLDTSFEGPLFARATRIDQVMYVPGDLCFGGPPAERPRHHMRLSFGVQSPEGIDEGMRRLASAVRAVNGTP